MKQLLSLFCIVMLLIACNNSGKDQNVHEPGIDSQEKNWKEAIEKYPDSILLKEELAQYYRTNGSYDMALSVINLAIQKDSSIARLWDIKATLHIENDDTLQAVNAYEKAISISPEPSYLMSLGALYAQLKNARALFLADQLLIIDKARAEKQSLFIKGLFYNYSGDKKKAISFFDNCLAMDYTFMFAYREKGIALFDLGKYEEALEVLNKAVTLQNNFDEGYYWMGRCFEKLNRPNEAIESYQTALQYDPDFIEAKVALDKLGVK